MIAIESGYFIGMICSIMGGMIGFTFGIAGYDFRAFQIIAIIGGIIFFIGIVFLVYYSPLENAQVELNKNIEQNHESQIKQMSCISIQKYLLDSLPNDNTTTKFAHSVFDLKCKGVSLT